MRKLNLLGLVVAVALALTAPAAASAAEFKSESTSGTTYFTDVNEGNFVLKAGATVTCTSFTGEGEFVGTAASSLEISNIALSGCTLAGQNAKVEMRACTVVIGQPTGTSSPYTEGTVKIKCPAGASVVITAVTSGCTVTVGPQTPTSASSVVDNPGPPQTLTVIGGLSGISYLGSGGICGGSGTTGTSTWTLIKKFFSDHFHTKQVGGTVK